MQDRCLDSTDTQPVVLNTSAETDVGYSNGLLSVYMRPPSPLIRRDPPASLAQTYETWSQGEPTSASYTGFVATFDALRKIFPEWAKLERANDRAHINMHASCHVECRG